MSAAQDIHDAVDELTAAQKLITGLEEACTVMANTGKLNTSGVVALYEVTKKLEDIDNRLHNAITKLGA